MSTSSRRSLRAAFFLGASAAVALTALAYGCVGPVPTIATGDDAAVRPDATSDAPNDAPVDTSVAADANTSDVFSVIDANVVDAFDAGIDAPVDANTTYCQSQLPPLGIATSDFLCVDFDESNLVPFGGDGGVTSYEVSDGGRLEILTNVVSVSAPNALGAAALNSSTGGGGGAVIWSPQSATNFETATAEVEINPATSEVSPETSGSVALIDIRTQTSSVTFSITHGANVSSMTNYNGYLIEVAEFGGAAVRGAFAVSESLPASAWTQVKLSYGSGGAVQLSLGGVIAYSGNGYAANDPSIKFTVGAESDYNSSVAPEFRFDNMKLSVSRSQ